MLLGDAIAANRLNFNQIRRIFKRLVEHPGELSSKVYRFVGQGEQLLLENPLISVVDMKDCWEVVVTFSQDNIDHMEEISAEFKKDHMISSIEFYFKEELIDIYFSPMEKMLEANSTIKYQFNK